MTISHISNSGLMAFNQQPLEASLLAKDDAFDARKIADYTLCIEIGDDRFRFVVTTSQNQCLWLEDYSLRSLMGQTQLMLSIAKLYEQHEFLSNNAWKNISVSFNTPHFTLIPLEFFRKEYTDSYLQLMRGAELQSNEVVLSHALKTIDARNTFVCKKELYEWILNTYSPHTPIMIHQTSTLIDGALYQNKANEVQLLLYFEEEYLSMVITKGKELLLCNKFQYSVAQDMGYYVLYAITNLNIKPSDVACVLYGEVTPYSDDYQWLQKFLPNISFGRNGQGLVLGEAFEDLPEHRYFSLYGIHSA